MLSHSKPPQRALLILQHCDFHSTKLTRFDHVLVRKCIDTRHACKGYGEYYSADVYYDEYYFYSETNITHITVHLVKSSILVPTASGWAVGTKVR